MRKDVSKQLMLIADQIDRCATYAIIKSAADQLNNGLISSLAALDMLRREFDRVHGNPFDGNPFFTKDHRAAIELAMEYMVEYIRHIN